LQGGGASQLEMFMTDYNVTGVSFDDTSIDTCDAINAAAAMRYTRALYTARGSECLFLGVRHRLGKP